MIEKNKLQSIISKYYLGGLIESTKWEIQNNVLNINLMSPTKDMVGNINCTNFLLEDCVLAIFNTSQLNKLLQITSGQIEIAPIKSHKATTKLTFQDASFTVEYSLADPLMIQSPPTINEPNTWDVIASLEPNDVLAFTKASSAIQNSELVILQPNKTIDGKVILEFTFGDKTEFSNKITLEIDASHNIESGQKIPFNSNMLKEIFHNNKGANSTILKFTQEGLLKLEFEFKEENIKTTYFVVRKADY